MKLGKLMYCEAHKCKLTQFACNARKVFAEKQLEEEGKPKKRGRPFKKLTLLDPEKCLECKDGLKELKSGQVPGITDEGLGAKTCKECGEEKANHYFDRGKDVCELCKIREKEALKEKIQEAEKQRKEKDLADFIEAETTSEQMEADINKLDHIKPTQPDGILSIDLNIVDGLKDALKKAADEDVRTVEQQALFMLKVGLYEDPVDEAKFAKAQNIIED